MGGAQTWYLYGPLRILAGNWTNTGTLLVQGAQTNEGSLTVLGAGGNVVTNGQLVVATNTVYIDATNAAYVAAKALTNGLDTAASVDAKTNAVRAYVDSARKTNEIMGGWYSMNNSVTSLLMKVDEALVVTQLCAIADYPGSCTVTVFTSTYWSNAVIGYTVATNVWVSSTGSVINCFANVPAGGGIWQCSNVGATSCTNLQMPVMAVRP
jgi:hypothetical protein